MAKRTNRVAWGLAAVRAASLVGGGAVGIAHSNGSLRVGRVRIAVLPRRDWHVGCGPVVWAGSSAVVGHRLSMGILEVELNTY